MENDNKKLLKSLEDIQSGKRLNVVSHNLKASPKKSLILQRKRYE